MGPMEFGLFRRWRAERSWGYLSPGSGCTLKHSRVSCFFFDNPQLVYPRRAAVIVCRQAVCLAVLSPEDRPFRDGYQRSVCQI